MKIKCCIVVTGMIMQVDGKLYSTQDHSLVLQKFEHDKGADPLGHWTSLDVTYMAGTKPIILSYRVYEGIPAVIFGQVGHIEMQITLTLGVKFH